MRISDWSSYVCSSDLAGGGKAGIGGQVDKHILPAASDVTETGWETKWMAMKAALDTYDCAPSEISQDVEDVLGEAYLKAQQVFMDSPAYDPRSEEHTSELQSLMRNSYAVFCLKKKMKLRS